jgi:hypothetical protein
MEAPIGFVPLRGAVDAVGRKLLGDKWHPINQVDSEVIACKLDPQIEGVIKLIAEKCEAGEIAATYPIRRGGADALDCGVWRAPHWRNYFAEGTIDLELPLLDANDRPSSEGFTVKCTREIFVRRQDLDRLLQSCRRKRAVPERQRNMIGLH